MISSSASDGALTVVQDMIGQYFFNKAQRSWLSSRPSLLEFFPDFREAISGRCQDAEAR